MAELAASQGVPREALIEETQALDTIQNAYYSVKIMEAHGWHSAEVVSSPSHLPRASLIFAHFPITWRMHAAPWPPEYRFFHRAANRVVRGGGHGADPDYYLSRVALPCGALTPPPPPLDTRLPCKSQDCSYLADLWKLNCGDLKDLR